MPGPGGFVGVGPQQVLTVTEQDGSPSVSGVRTIRVSNGTLTNDGGGVVSIDTGGGGSGDVTGPAGATSGHLAVFSGPTGKVIADGGPVPTSITNSAGADVLPKSNGTDLVASQLTDDGTILSMGGVLHAVVSDANTVTIYVGSPSANSGVAVRSVVDTNNSLWVARGIGLGANLSSPTLGVGVSSSDVVEINNGTLGTYRDIKVRDAFLDGEKNLAGLATDSNGKIVVAASDARLKDIVGDFTDGLEAIKQITPQQFTWKDERRAGVQAGLIAQNVQTAIPLGVSEFGDQGYLQLEKDAILAAAINAIKELSAKVDAQAAEIQKLKDSAAPTV